jgi:hypothetical protein
LDESGVHFHSAVLRRSSFTNANAERNSHSKSNGNADTDAVYGKMLSYTPPASDAASASKRRAPHLSGRNSERYQLVMHNLRELLID